MDDETMTLGEYWEGIADGFIEAMQDLDNDEERLGVIYLIREHICLECGNMRLPCYCGRDQ